MNAYELAMIWSGIFLFAGMLTGVWKYRCILRSPEATAPAYVNIAHRSALLYSFAAVILALLAQRSVWAVRINLLGVWLNVAFFALTIASYALHGVLNDTDNQFRRPHVIGTKRIPAAMSKGFMLSLMAAQMTGLLILLSGFWLSLSV